jgi:DNA-binding NarL/FixJ family response regulator
MSVAISRVVILSSSPLFRDGLRGMLEQSPSVRIAGTADTWETALALVQAEQPDAVIVDQDERTPARFLDDLFAVAERLHVILLSHQHDRLAIYSRTAVEHPSSTHLLAAVLESARRPLPAAS